MLLASDVILLFAKVNPASILVPPFALPIELYAIVLFVVNPHVTLASSEYVIIMTSFFPFFKNSVKNVFTAFFISFSFVSYFAFQPFPLTFIESFILPDTSNTNIALCFVVTSVVSAIVGITVALSSTFVFISSVGVKSVSLSVL